MAVAFRSNALAVRRGGRAVCVAAYCPAACVWVACEKSAAVSRVPCQAVAWISLGGNAVGVDVAVGRGVGVAV